MKWNRKLLESQTVHFEVPRADNTCLISPELFDAREIIEANRSELAAHSQDRFFDTTIGELKAATQAILIRLARDWTSRSIPVLKDSSGCACAHRQNEMLSRCDEIIRSTSEHGSPIILSGHQPEIFHNGVWFKNAIISKLGNQENGVAINLVIDHDLPKHVGINVPVLANDELVTTRTISPIKLNANVPWEVLDDYAEIDASFANEVVKAGQDVLPHEPLVSEYWDYFQDSRNRDVSIGHSIAAARHRLERERGWNSLELPMSQLCNTWEFGTFVAEIISRAEELQVVYNEARDEYRRAHRLRNDAHPVPALTSVGSEDEHWCELPFWIYSETNPKRRQLWLLRSESGYALSDHEQMDGVIELGDGPILSLEIWDSLVEQGIKIRPRALMTTTFLRLFAADLFVHGIGGGKYDQVTDQIILQMWGIEPPRFIVASASLHLPMLFKHTSVELDSKQLHKMIRDVKYHPEMFLSNELSGNPDVVELLSKKASLIGTASNATNRRAWHHEMEAVNDALSQHLTGLRERLSEQLTQSHIKERQRKLLQSREYSFVLFSKTDVFRRLEQFIPEACRNSPVA